MVRHSAADRRLNEFAAAIHGGRPSGHRCAMSKIVPDDFLRPPSLTAALRAIAVWRQNRSRRFFAASFPGSRPFGPSLRDVKNRS